LLAKIHLKTACGCERSYYEHIVHMPQQLRIPIRDTRLAWEPINTVPETVHNVRVRCFHIVLREWKSKYRVELWFEETTYD
jgi:hypothetical protein